MYLNTLHTLDGQWDRGLWGGSVLGRLRSFVCWCLALGTRKIMSGSLSEASKATLGALAEYLSEPHLGVKLPRALIGPLTLYIHTTLKMEDPEEVDEMGAQALVAAVNACGLYPSGAPEATALTVKSWYENEPGPKIAKRYPPTPTHDDEVEVVEPPLAKIVTAAKARMSAEEEADIKSMGLAGAVEVKCLALSSETGQVHAPHEVGDMGWGSDPRLTDIAKQRRKSGMDSLTKHLDNKDSDAVLVHFSSLIRDLTQEGLTQEVSVVTGWLMELQQWSSWRTGRACSSTSRSTCAATRGAPFP